MIRIKEFQRIPARFNFNWCCLKPTYLYTQVPISKYVMTLFFFKPTRLPSDINHHVSHIFLKFGVQ